MTDIRQGIVHIIGPEQGLTQPGMTIVCGDSHTATHGAFGALAFGIGTSEVEHVLATQTLIQKPAKNMRIAVDGDAAARRHRQGRDPRRSSARSAPPAAPATSSNMPARRSARCRMEGRMTVCNMSIEAGARAGLIAPDETTFAYLQGRPMAPKGAAWERPSPTGGRSRPMPARTFDKEVTLEASEIAPQVTWGTSPEDVLPITGSVPDPGGRAR